MRLLEPSLCRPRVERLARLVLDRAVWGPLRGWLEQGLRGSAEAVWTAAWGSSANIVSQLPSDLTYNFGPQRAIAVDPFAIAIGGATHALVLLGLRTLLGSIVGRDHLITHVLTRLIPAVFLTLAYPLLLARGLGIGALGLGLRFSIFDRFAMGWLKDALLRIIGGAALVGGAGVVATFITSNFKL